MTVQLQASDETTHISNSLWFKNGVIALTRSRRIFQFIGHIQASELLDDVIKIRELSCANSSVDCALVIADANHHALLPDGTQFSELRIQFFNDFSIGCADRNVVDKSRAKHASSSMVSVFIGPVASLTPVAEIYGHKYIRKVLMHSDIN